MNQDDKEEEVKYPLLEKIDSWSSVVSFIDNCDGNVKDLLKEIENSSRKNDAEIAAAERRIIEAKSLNKGLYSVVGFLKAKLDKETLSYLETNPNQVVSIGIDRETEQIKIERIDINIS